MKILGHRHTGILTNDLDKMRGDSVVKAVPQLKEHF